MAARTRPSGGGPHPPSPPGRPADASADGSAVTNRLSDIALLASQLCGTRGGYVTAFEGDLVRPVVVHGASRAPIHRRHAFCSYAAAEPDGVLVVPDARADRRFAENPLVVDAPHLRFYAGASCVDAAGEPVGTVAALGLSPADLDDAERAGLRALAREASALLDERASGRSGELPQRHRRRGLVRSLQAAIDTGAEVSTVVFEMSVVLLTLPSVISVTGWVRGPGGEWLRIAPRLGAVVAEPGGLVAEVVTEGGVAWSRPQEGRSGRTVALMVSSSPGREVVLEVEVVDAREASLIADAVAAVAAAADHRLADGPRGAHMPATPARAAGVAVVAAVPGLHRLLLAAGDAARHEAEVAVRDRIGRRLDGAHRVQRLDGERWLATAQGLAVDQTPVATPDDDLSLTLRPHGAATRLAVYLGFAVRRDGNHHDGYDRLARDAERAAYQAVESGRQVCVCDEELERQEHIEADVAGALASGAVVLRYQPKVALATGRIVAVEALARWEHPVLGPVSPTEFVPIVDRLGMSDRLLALVLGQARGAARTWRAAGHPLSVAVNLSRSLLATGVAAELVGDVLADGALWPQHLVVEVTESVLGAQDDVLARRLEELRALGVRIAIDDFGCGYSTLGALRGLPVDELKLDRSLLVDVDTDAGARSIVDAVAMIGSTLGLEVVAEGIERESQARAALASGCTTGQGFLWGRAVDVDEITARLDAEGVDTIRR